MQNCRNRVWYHVLVSDLFRNRLKSILRPSENKILGKLSSPQKIQDYLDTLPTNFESGGETYMSPRRVFETGIAHCFEGALVAAAALAYHSQKAYMMDFQTAWDDEDHVVAVFKQNGHWGAISKTNHSVLRYRDPIYKTVRELAASYFHEYFMWDGRKSLRAHSAPFDMAKIAPEKWVTAREELYWLVEDLDKSPHFPLVPKMNMKKLRRVAKIELNNMKHTEWVLGKDKKPRRES